MKTKRKLKLKNNWKTKTKTEKYIKTNITLRGILVQVILHMHMTNNISNVFVCHQCIVVL